jgi:hypothetical protein
MDRVCDPSSQVKRGLSCLCGKSIILAKRFLTLYELAAYLDVSCERLIELIEREDNADFPGIRIKGEWLVPLDEVPDWLLRLMSL